MLHEEGLGRPGTRRIVLEQKCALCTIAFGPRLLSNRTGRAAGTKDSSTHLIRECETAEKRIGAESHYPNGVQREAVDRGRDEEDRPRAEVDVGIPGDRGFDASVLCA